MGGSCFCFSDSARLRRLRAIPAISSSPSAPSRFHPNSSQSIPTSSQRHPDRDEPLHPNPSRPHPNRSQAICILAELPNLRSSVFICGHSISSFLCGLCVVPLLPSRLRRFRAITAIPAIRCGHSISSFLCGLCVVPLLPSRLRRFRAITAIPAIRTSLCRLSRGSQPLNDKTSAFAEAHNSPAQPIHAFRPDQPLRISIETTIPQHSRRARIFLRLCVRRRRVEQTFRSAEKPQN
jgi:hypothetical protein